MANTTEMQQPAGQAPGRKREADIIYLDKRVFRVNRRLFFGLLAGTAIAGVLVHLLHIYNVGRNAENLRERALEAYKAGKSEAAVREMVRFLQLRPRDTDAMLQLGEWTEERARSGRSLRQAYFAFDRALTIDPTLTSARKRVTRLAVRLGRYAEALGYWDETKLVAIVGEEAAREIAQVAAADAELFGLLAMAEHGLGRLDAAAMGYAEAIRRTELEQSDGQPPSTTRENDLFTYYLQLMLIVDRPGVELKQLPELQRQFSREKSSDEGPVTVDRDAVVADILAAMVRNARPAWRAFLSRSAYRQSRGDLDGAFDDLDEALAEGGDRADVLLKASELELARSAQLRFSAGYSDPVKRAAAEEEFRKHREAAAEYARRGLKLTPPDLRFYVSLSQIELDAGNLDEAESRLRDGLAAVGELSPLDADLDPDEERQRVDLEVRLVWSLGNLLVTRAMNSASGGQLADSDLLPAREQIRKLRELGARDGLSDYLQGRIDMAAGRWADAIAALQRARIGLTGTSEAVRDADLLLAECYRVQMDPDARVAVLQHALELDRFWIPTRVALAEALAARNGPGDVEEALRQYTHSALRNVATVPESIARLAVSLELSKPRSERRLKAAAQRLEEARKIMPDNVDLALLHSALCFQHWLDDRSLPERAKAAEASLTQAEEILGELRLAHASDPAVWAAQARLTARRPDLPREKAVGMAEQTLEEARAHVADDVPLRIVRAELAEFLPAEAASVALTRLQEGVESLVPAKKRQLSVALAHAWLRTDDAERFSKALELLRSLSESATDDLGVQMLTAELVARVDPRDEREGTCRTFLPILERVRRLEGRDGPNGNFLEGSELLARVEWLQKNATSSGGRTPALRKELLDRAVQLLNRATDQRPGWAAAHASLGRAELARGIAGQPSDLAYSHFRKAIDLGDRSRDTLLRTMNHLLDQKRTEDVNELVRQIDERSPDLLSGGVGRLAAYAAFDEKRFDDALNLLNRQGQGERTYRDDLFEGLMRFARGERQGAVDEALARAVAGAKEQKSADMSPWVTRVNFLVDQKRLPEAKALIQEAAASLPDEPAYVKPLALGLCYERTGDVARAGRQFARLIEVAPQDASVRIEAMKFYFRTKQLELAEQQIERLLDPQVGAPPSVQEAARQARAMIVSSRGTYSDLERGLAQLEESTGTDLKRMSAVALRSRAIILARSGLRRDALRLIAVYEELDKRRELAALERHQLARLYDVIGEPKKSLDAYRQLIRHGAPTGVILAEAALALCVRKAASDEVVAEAAEYVSRLQQLEPHSFRTALTRARLLEAQGNPHGAVTALKGFLTTLQVASPEELVRELIKQRKPGEAMDALIDAARRQGDAAAKAVSAHIEKLRRGGDEAEATEVLKRYIRAADFVQAIHAEAIRLVAGVFEAMRQHEAAEEMYNRFVASTQQPDASLVLAAYQARRNRIDEALDLCDRAPERCPPDAVARVSVGILRSGKTTREQIERVEKRILDALEKADAATPQAVNLSIALADLRDFQTRYADAIAIYRSLLERNERNVVVLNNLAWLVSFLPVDRESSLRYIDQALQLAGPVATLLDTRAVIQINLKKPGDAVRDLEQALLEVQDNPGIWYHMALAQLRLGSRAEATEAWKRALALGFDPSSLHALERDGYDSLVNALETGNQRASR